MGNQHKKMGTPSVGVQFKRVAEMKSFEKNNWVRRGGARTLGFACFEDAFQRVLRR